MPRSRIALPRRPEQVGNPLAGGKPFGPLLASLRPGGHRLLVEPYGIVVRIDRLCTFSRRHEIACAFRLILRLAEVVAKQRHFLQSRGLRSIAALEPVGDDGVYLGTSS
ncbi:hypothetical protein D3C87_1682440 [compost metagenome]